MNLEIVGRKKEQNELKNIFQSKKAELVAIYGRRRVGKTYLIRNFFKAQRCIYFQSMGLQNGSLQEQLQNFTDALSEAFYDKTPLQTVADWRDAFHRLTGIIERKNKKDKIVLFFDELPWMATPRSGLLDALDYFWNKYWVNFSNLKVFICGSSASWILKKIIYHRGGLHNRVTRQIALKPFLLNETVTYLNSLGCRFDHKQVLEIYMAIGGIPYYLNGIKRQLSASQNINQLCFRREGLLFDEFDKLFRSLFNDADAYIELIRMIAQKKYGISRPELEKACALSQRGGTLTDRLNDLEEAGFILSFLPLQHKAKGIYYRVIDEFSLFYLTWIEPEKKTLLKVESDSHFWLQKHKTPLWNNWSGYAFEAICYKHLDNIRSALAIPNGSRSGVWRVNAQQQGVTQGAQIDLLFDREDGIITLCEIKFTTLPFVISKEYAKNLLDKKTIFMRETKTEKQIMIGMVTSCGIKNNFYAEDLIDGVTTIDDLYDF